MATNFRESLKSAMAANVNTYATARVMTLAEEPAVAAYSLDTAAEETWIRSDKYLWYEEYADENISTIDEDKNIVVHQKQINVTQESNSQFIPFRMPRRYDNVDLMEKTLLIHFTNSRGNEDNDSPVNVSYSDNYIQFAWLVRDTATAIEGEVNFEIQAVGVNSKGGEYIWKTRPNGKLNIEKSLSGNGIIEPDSSWITSFMTQVTEKVAEAQTAANEAKAAAAEAQESANNVAGQIIDVVSNAMEETLSNYYTKEESEQKATELITSALSNHYTKEEVDQIIAEQDFTEVLDEVQKKIDAIDGLANLVVEYDQITNTMTFKNGETEIVSHVLNTNPTDEWTENLMTSVQGKINDSVNPVSQKADILERDLSTLSENLSKNYYTSAETDEKFAIKIDVENISTELEKKASADDVSTLRTNVDELIETLNSKASNEEVSTLRTNLSAVETTTNTNKSDLSTLSTKVGELEQQINELPTSAGKEYYATYDTDHVFKLYEIDGENESVKSQFTISGGGGGVTTTTTVKIDRITASPLVVTKSDKAIIEYNFSSIDSSGDDTGEGTATWKVGNNIVATSMAIQGNNSFDLTDYVSLGTQKITLSITDAAGTMSVKTWTIQVVDVRLESSFNDKLTYPMGTIAFDYTPYGAISKEIHFILDGKELETITISTSGIPMGYTIPAQEHGAHLFEVYMTATINNNTIESNHIVKDILWYDENSDIPVIGCVQQNITALQYDTTNIVYTVYDPKTESPEVVLAVDEKVVSTLTLDSNTQTWPFKTADIGDHVLTITCGKIVKTIKVKIEELDIEIEPVTAGLVIDFNPVGKSNSDTDRVWHNDTYKMSVSDNFDWVNGGYQIDNAGDQYFCIKAGTSVDIDYQMFADDAKRNGKEMKLIFRTTNVQEANAQFVSCVDNTTGTDHIGIEMFAHEAFIYGSADKLNLKYSENDIIEFEFNITKNTEKVTEICGYEDGVPTRHLVYDDTFNFTQSAPKTIRLGSDKCDLHIYRLKIYNTSLTDRGVLNNFIADARTADEMIDRHKRNQIYDENQQLIPEILAEKCPWLRVYVVSAPYFTNKKSDKVPYTTIKQIYKNGDPILDNWTCYDCSHSGQGTSSDNYGAAARNLDFIMNKSQIEGITPYFILGDGKTRAEKVSLTRTSIPNAYFNFKANVASSNHFTNALLAKRYNEFNPYILPYVREDESIIDYIKTTMEFHNAVVFIQETDPDLSTHREFADNDIHFYSIGNIGDSKKTDVTRLVDPTDRYECINEICDVELPLSDWPNTEEAIAALEAEKFDKSGSYEWRYIWEDGTDEENVGVREYCKQKWIEMYKFVVQSTDEEFKAHFEDYFVLDSVLYYYLFTTRYCMVDNRAKNSFWHYGKTGAVDTEGNPIRKWDLTMMYDCDSSMSLNNYGNSVYRHGYEDTDTMDGTNEEVFRESDSTFFCRVRDLFSNELKEMYNALESKNAWHAESFLNEIEAWQKQFPEELWRLDCQRKNIRTVNESFINGAGDPQYLKNMAQGRMLYPVKQWERSQEVYMASKYQSSVASSDNIVLRCTVPTGDLVVPANYKLKLTPYDYIYLNVKYGTQEPIQVRAVPGVQYEIPFEGNSVDILDIYSASRIQDLGDLSSTYPATVDTAKASRLKRLDIGNATEGYDNPYLTTITLGANYLLEVLNVENVSGLTQSLNLSDLNNLKELYAHGTNAGGVTFANGGAIQIAELPAITSMSAKNLAYLADLDVESYDKLTTLTLENCSTIDILNIFELAQNLNRIRITGIDWILTDTTLLQRIYKMAGVDKNDYNIQQSVLSGKVHVPVMKQQQLADYQNAWPDLEITYDTLVAQYTVTFKNDDGTILDVQYVDKGTDAVDPITRTENPITIPVKESTVSTDFTYAGWDSLLTSVFSDRVITATYSESIRSYTVRYLSKGVVLQENVSEYGTTVFYNGDTPVYTAEEAAFKYYLFTGWDKSGYVNGNKDINAVFDTFEYFDGCFEGKELSDLRMVELYGMTKLGYESRYLIEKDSMDITFGHDCDYDDIESLEFISEKTVFNGTNHIDTGVQLFSEDRDFVLAIDYKFLTGTTNGNVLAQCFQADGSNGFKLWYNNEVKTTWGTSTGSSASINKREIIVIRHKKGEYGLHVYNSYLDQDESQYIELTRTKSTQGTAPLVFGCARADDGIYENHAVGEIYWAKLWYTDLGDEMCKKLALWVHEKIKFELSGFKNYYLSENSSKRCSISFLAAELLERPRKLSTSSASTGGWANFTLNKFLNKRFYEAIPEPLKSMIKKVRVSSSIGDKSTELEISNCHIKIPSVIQVDPSKIEEPYFYEGTSVSYITTDETRKRAYVDGNYAAYWTYSPNVGYASYVFQIKEDGTVYGFVNPNNTAGILIEFSI